MNDLAIWAVLLVFQNASFTWVSRARNSGSDWYHAVASIFSNGIWFFAMYFTFDYLDQMKAAGDVRTATIGGAIYIIATLIGSVGAGMFLRRYVERGSRRVGYYSTK